jgi:hypothetical protein
LNNDDGAAVQQEKKYGAIPEGVKVPMKGVFYGIPTSQNTTCTPVPTLGSMDIGGSATHLGDLQFDHSFWNNTDCSFDAATMVVTQKGPGQLMADNGDILYIYAVVYVHPLTNTFDGTTDFTGGTGRFEGATGHVDLLNGIIGPEKLTWTTDGWIIFKK